MNNLFKLELNLSLPKLWVHISTPDFTVSNPAYYPSWYPKFVLEDFNKQTFPTDLRYHLTLTWVFHLTVGWGKQTPAKFREDVMSIPKEAALYRFGEGENAVYMLSSIHNEQTMRAQFNYQDHGGMDYDAYEESTQRGPMKKIESLSEIPKEDWETLPYTCGEDYKDKDGKWHYGDWEISLREIMESR